MEVTCKVGIIEYSVSDECGGGKDTEWERRGRKGR
jgi:hypothetical protein